MQKSLETIHISKIQPPDDPIRDKIDPNGINELADSIKQRGLLQPLLVTQDGDGYKIVAGHRRYLACVQLGLSEVDCYVYSPLTEEDKTIDMAHENLIRENLNIIEEAKLIKSLVYDNARGVEEVAKILSKSPTWVDNRIEILEWPQEVLDALEKGAINIAVAKELAKIKNESQRQSILDSAIQYGVPARVVKQWIDDFSVTDYLNQKKISRETGGLIAAGTGPLTMPCKVCQNKFEMNLLRHVWLCPDCMMGVNHLAEAVQDEMAKEKNN